MNARRPGLPNPPAIDPRWIGALVLVLVAGPLLARFGLYGPPGIIFFDRGGKEIAGLRVVGFQEAARFVKQLARAAG